MKVDSRYCILPIKLLHLGLSDLFIGNRKSKETQISGFLSMVLITKLKENAGKVTNALDLLKNP